MARRKKHEEHANHEAWAIPYGDLVTLLLAFFVVMYAISSINEGKYRVLSDSLVAAFRAAPRSLDPVQVGKLARSEDGMGPERPRVLVPLEIESVAPVARLDDAPTDLMRAADLDERELEEAAELIDRIATELADALSELIDEELIRLNKDRFWLEIEINTSLLFASGSAGLADEARPVLERVASILSGSPTRINVEGHTDSRPISTNVFPSNWELSAARSSSVVHLFMREGMEPERMAAVGFGQYRPASENDTAAGRRANRRVVVVVMAGPRARTEWRPPADGGGDPRRTAPAAPEDTS